MTDPLVPVLAFGIPAIAALVLLLGWISYSGMVRIRIREPAWILSTSLESGDFTQETLDRPWIRESLASPRGYRIAVHALKGKAGGTGSDGGGKLAIFHHGITWNWHGMLRYMECFAAAGWTVVALDSRGHGEGREPGGPRPSFGFYEKEDLKAVADWALASFPHGGGYLVFGESMGAATCLQYAAIDPRVDAVVADCPFSCAASELDHRLRRTFVPFFLRPLVVRVADYICRRLDGFSLFAACPERAILETRVPIMFVHGLDDDYVPWKMSVVMAETRRRRLPDAMTELRLVPDADHAHSRNADPAAYDAAVLDFVGEALAGKASSV